MRNLDPNDWLTLNSLIYNIYTTEDLTVMRQQLLEQLKMIIDFDSADFYLVKEEDEKDILTAPVYYNCDSGDADFSTAINYNKDIAYNGKSIVYRDTDIISDEKRMQSEYYQKIYKTNNWHYSLQLILGRDKKFLGTATFYRTIGKDNFLYDDIFIIDLLKDHLAYRLSHDRESALSDSGKLTVTQASEKFELTRRERDILRHLMEGLDNDDICDQLCISVNTLKKHILNIYRKLGINNRVQLFKMIMEKE